MGMVKEMGLVILFVTISLFGCTNANGGSQESSMVHSQENGEIKKIQGFDSIRNSQLRIAVSWYLYYSQNQDYLNQYAWLSDAYKYEYFPDIQNASAYNDRMLNKSEISFLKYLSITNVAITSSEAKIDLVYETISEGKNYRVQATLLFVKEGTYWKYNGRRNLKYIERVRN